MDKRKKTKGQTTQWTKEKRQKDKQRVAVHSVGNSASLKFPAGTIPVEYIFLCYCYMSLTRFTSLKIDGNVVCLSFAKIYSTGIVPAGNFKLAEFPTLCTATCCQDEAYTVQISSNNHPRWHGH
jgi:hypothetical protein